VYRASLEQLKRLVLGFDVHPIAEIPNDVFRACQYVVRLLSLLFCCFPLPFGERFLFFRYDPLLFGERSLFFRCGPLLFGELSLLFGVPTKPSCEHCQNAYNGKRNISDPRPSALCLRSLLERFLGVVQSFLTLSLSCGHCIKLLALLAQSRCRHLFACADEVEVQGRGLGRTLRPTRHPSLGLGYIVS
jgi:hypothetical protein